MSKSPKNVYREKYILHIFEEKNTNLDIFLSLFMYIYSASRKDENENY